MDPIFFFWLDAWINGNQKKGAFCVGYLTVAVLTFVSVLFLALPVGIIGHELPGKLECVTENRDPRENDQKIPKVGMLPVMGVEVN